MEGHPSRETTMRHLFTKSVALLLLAACSSDSGPTIEPPPPPAVVSAAVSAGPHNVLSAAVSAALQHADSVAVRYGPGEALDSTTPARSLPGDAVGLPVLELTPPPTSAKATVT